MKRAAIIAIGSEMLLGIRIDTNSSEIAQALTDHGFRVESIQVLGDDPAPLAAAVREAASRFDLVVIGGGLGPTHDDVTRRAVADALDLPLVRTPELVELLRRFPFAPDDPGALFYVQADLVSGAEALPPVTGTAPGQLITGPVGDILLLPGPPREMRPLLARYLERFEESRLALSEVTVVGLSESAVMERIIDLVDDDIELTLLASTGSVQVVLFDSDGNDHLGPSAERIVRELGDHVVSTRGASLAETVLDLARDAGVTIGTVESCTGGMVASALTGIPGSSDVFLGGLVTYSNEAKRTLLGVGESTLAEHGAVSAQTAQEMAEGGGSRLGSDLTVAVTGIAGPGGGSDAKPVGTVWFGVRFRGAAYTDLVRFHGNREVVRERATAHALDLMRRAILSFR